jgi:hypothetical protein
MVEQISHAPLPTRWVPPATLWKLRHPAIAGERHEQIKEIACSLAGQGFESDEIFALLRPRYYGDVIDVEIKCLITWAQSKSFRPCLKGVVSNKAVLQEPAQAPIGTPAKEEKAEDAAQRRNECITTVLKGFNCSETDLRKVSPVPIPDDPKEHASLLLSNLYHSGEKLNIVTDYVEVKPKDGGTKYNPTGYGKTLERDEWLRHFAEHGIPQDRAGAWLRMNPVNGEGIADANVVAYRFALIEFDTIPLNVQLALFAKLPLPIVAILTSGGKSVHGWVRVNGTDLDTYRSKVKDLLTLLKSIGVDQNNKNPSRLSRLVGVHREFGASEDGLQRLIYLAPEQSESRSIL